MARDLYPNLNANVWTPQREYRKGDILLNPETNIPVVLVVSRLYSTNLSKELQEGKWNNLVGGTVPIIPIADNFPDAIVASLNSPLDGEYYIGKAGFMLQYKNGISVILNGGTCDFQLFIDYPYGSGNTAAWPATPLSCVAGENFLPLLPPTMPFGTTFMLNNFHYFELTNVVDVTNLTVTIPIAHRLY